MPRELPDLPDHLRRSAYEARNGELAWRRGDALEVLEWLASRRIAVLGGELWEVLGDGRWQGMIPSREQDGTFVWGWSTTPTQRSDESWSDYVERARLQAIEALKSGRAEDQASLEVRPRLRYNLAYESREDQATAAPHDI